MNSKKIILTIVFLAISGFLFNFGTPNAKAITTVELQAQIQQLLQQITQLQQQLSQMQGEEGTWCHDFRANLRWGDAGSEVSALQTALEKEGLYEREGDQPPHFDDGVASAVTAFQERYASETLTPWGLSHGTGYVGNTTRAKLNQLYGCTGSGDCHISPLWSWDYCSTACKCNVGEGDCDSNSECITGYCALDVGAEYGQISTIDVCKEKLTEEEEAYIIITFPNGGERWEVGSKQTIRWTSENVPTGQPVNIVSLKDSSGKEYHLLYDTPNDGSEKITVPSLKPGSYRLYLETTVKKQPVSDYSDNYFSIVEEEKDTTGCHTGSPGSADYCSTNCKCDAGEGDCDSDEECNTGYCAQGYGMDFCEETTEEEEEKESITVTSPNGGEQWEIGKTYNITWTSSGIDEVVIELQSGSTGWHLVYDAPASSGRYSWTIPTTQATGSKYKIAIWNSDNATPEDKSDGYFSIVSATSADVQSPTGTLTVSGDRKVGEPISITVTGHDNVDVDRLRAYYGDSWHTYYCSGTQTSCTHTWTTTEQATGTFTYVGYVYDSSGNGAYTTPSFISVSIVTSTASILSAPTLLSPSNGATNVSTTPTLDWNTVSEANWYHLYFRKSGSVSWQVRSSLTDSKYTFSGSEALDSGSTYSWQVRACRTGSECEDSSTRLFTTTGAILPYLEDVSDALASVLDSLSSFIDSLKEYQIK